MESNSVLKRYNLVRLAAVTMAILLMVLLWYGLAAGSGVEGRKAAGFDLVTFDGETLSLSELQGRVVVLNFWASWCKPCREEAPALESVWREYSPTSVAFVGVNVKDTRSNALAFMTRYGISYPNGADTYGRIARTYFVRGYPETLVLGKDGVVSQRYVGAVDEEQLRGSIQELLRQ